MASAFLLLLTATCGIARREVFQHDGAIDLFHIHMHASGKQEKLNKSKVSDAMTNVSGEVEATLAFESFLLGSSSKLQRESAQLLHQSSHSVAGVDEASNLSSPFIFSSMPTSTSSFISSSSFSSSSSSPSLSLHHACDPLMNPFASKGEGDCPPCPGQIVTGSEGKQYQYIKSLAKGTFGEVWSVTDALTDDSRGARGQSSFFSCASCARQFKRRPEPTAAVKRSLKMASRMESLETSMAWGEVCAMKKCADSPYVAKMSDFFQKGDHYYIVMEFVPGRTLESHIQEKTVSLQTPHELALIFYDILRGLDYIHKQGISHRDIKPENVLITTDNRAKLIDFGLASDSTTEKKEVVGSFYYFPPEIQPEIGAATRYLGPEVDAFSLGAILYEMVTGEPAYSETNFPRPSSYSKPYFPTSHHKQMLSDVPEEIKGIIFCTQKEKIMCSDQEKKQGQCRCGISDIMLMSWMQEAAALDPPAHA